MAKTLKDNACRVTTHGAGVETMHILDNGTLRLGIMSGLDARIATIVHVPTGRELLQQHPPIPYDVSAYPYGISAWIKGGERIDAYSGVLHDHHLPADYVLSSRPKITRTEEGITYTAIHEASGMRLEKCYRLMPSGSQFRVEVRLTNTASAPIQLQLEHPLAWNTGLEHPNQTFVYPTFYSIDCFCVPDYDVVEIDMRLLSEPWVAILDDHQQAEMIITLTGIERASQLCYGTHGILCLYSPIMELDPMAVIDTAQTFYYQTPLAAEGIPLAIAPYHFRAQAAPSRTSQPTSIVHTRSRWDTLLPRPQHAMRRPGSCPVSIDAVIAPACLAEEARLFQRQGAKAFPPSAVGVPIHLVEALEDTAPEAYTLEVAPHGVTITGRPHGVWHGCQTLLDLLTPEQGALLAPCGRITDAPDLSLRGLLFVPDGPEWDHLLEAFALHVLARLKINTVSVPMMPALVQFAMPTAQQAQPEPQESPSRRPYTEYRQAPPEDVTALNASSIPASRVREMIARLRAMHIEVLPLCGITPARDVAGAVTAEGDAFLEQIISTMQPQRLNIRFQHLEQILPPPGATGMRAWTRENYRSASEGEIAIRQDDPEPVAFVKLVHRYYRFLRQRNVQMVLCTDYFQDVILRISPSLLTEYAGWVLENLPPGLVLQEISSTADSPAGSYFADGSPRMIGSPIPLPRLVRRHSQVLAREGGLGILPWGGELSPESLGNLEGVIWTSVYGWHADGPEIDEVRILMRERIAWIHSRRWA